jgi:type VI secretion system secreted protein Hcp
MRTGKFFVVAFVSLLAVQGLTAAPPMAAQTPIARGLGALSSLRARFYVTIEGTKQGKFKGEGRSIDRIEGLRFSYEVAAPHDALTGQTSGRRQHRPLTITKEWGASTPQLLQALATNEVLKSVVIEFVRTSPQGREEVYYSIKLTNASISDIKQYTDKESMTELEDVSFTFQRIELENRLGGTSAIDDWR